MTLIWGNHSWFKYFWTWQLVILCSIIIIWLIFAAVRLKLWQTKCRKYNSERLNALCLINHLLSRNSKKLSNSYKLLWTKRRQRRYSMKQIQIFSKCWIFMILNKHTQDASRKLILEFSILTKLWRKKRLSFSKEQPRFTGLNLTSFQEGWLLMKEWLKSPSIKVLNLGLLIE